MEEQIRIRDLRTLPIIIDPVVANDTEAGLVNMGVYYWLHAVEQEGCLQATYKANINKDETFTKAINFFRRKGYIKIDEERGIIKL